MGGRILLAEVYYNGIHFGRKEALRAANLILAVARTLLEAMPPAQLEVSVAAFI